MKISEKQLCQLIEIANIFTVINRTHPDRPMVSRLIREIMMAQSGELKEVE